ncbi:hypothetical protein M513_06009 [Trichuris suis]|uniref:Uncharacterized protein n=1 Tax=Trichuris suis TaxID=68888 RepID=A0A085M799_9BILA|nr:hypothetical protein M513_06009 [Trichuris suis]
MVPCLGITPTDGRNQSDEKPQDEYQQQGQQEQQQQHEEKNQQEEEQCVRMATATLWFQTSQSFQKKVLFPEGTDMSLCKQSVQDEFAHQTKKKSNRASKKAISLPEATAPNECKQENQVESFVNRVKVR